MIGIQIAGHRNRLSATAFARSLTSFLDLLKDVDSVVSQRPNGTVRWDISKLQMSSPALVELSGFSRVAGMDYSQAVQESVLDGIEQLAERPEQPQFYSFVALRKVQQMADQSRDLQLLSVFAGNRRAVLTVRISTNVEYLMASGSRSLGSIRGSLDAITVHSGYEFRVWSPKWKRPTVCYFDQAVLSDVSAHLKQEVEVIGEIQRNKSGEPASMEVQEFHALEPAISSPNISEMRGLLSDLYGGKSLKVHLDELRNG